MPLSGAALRSCTCTPEARTAFVGVEASLVAALACIKLRWRAISCRQDGAHARMIRNHPAVAAGGWYGRGPRPSHAAQAARAALLHTLAACTRIWPNVGPCYASDCALAAATAVL